MQKLRKIVTALFRQPRWRLIALAVLVAIAGVWWWNRGGKSVGKAAAFAARRGPLDITVLEGGSLQALEFQEIKCEVRVGYQGTKILRIVEEGYLVTDEDVKTNKVLVELDSSDIQKQIVQQEIQYQSAVASLIDAEQNYEIQLGQNQSDIKDAEQKARFARMDFDKFLGDTVTTQICDQLGLDKLLASATTNNVEQTTRAQEAARDKPAPAATAGVLGLPSGGTQPSGARPVVLVTTNASAVPVVAASPSATSPGPAADAPDAAADLSELEEPGWTNAIKVDFSPYANIDKLGDGEAKQKLRKFEDDLQVAQKELGQAQTTLDGTRRLFEKGFVTKTDRERDEIAFENSRLKVQTAESARDLFLKYDFVRSAEEALSKYAEAVRELDKARRVAISKLAQARAKLKSGQGQYQVQLRQRSDLNDQLEKCTLGAKKPGLVVYGSANDDMFYYGGEERVREGATVRERQAIITIPDMTHMAVKVKIHESYIKKIKKGQKARVTVDAFPDKVLTGEVTKVGVLPDSQNRWMNPDLKVYLTTITIDGTQDWVKPGMSTKVEILVNRLEDCVYVPVQAISPDGDKQVCYLAGSLKPERRAVEIGEFNDEFIQVKSGLKEGERVLLRLPDGIETQKAGQDNKPPEKAKDQPASPSTPQPTTPASAPIQARKA
ncbi:MAG TPA: HlyD family efflux transporter periplasmic adaptor subunit [Candidatus Acidoferrum sp.]|jgi:HlyD family secretion protein|nr:HlyD family efflux transporter periplasmic adaptor subunit [Candidatus Acidoferrum sp.]